jgi:prepilin-type N-terminal cleavage/methylation domain-containing protein
MRVPKSQRGVTLIEIAVALAILGIITALSIGAMSGARPRMDINSMSAQLAATVGEAQARAFRNRRDVWLIVYVASDDPPAKNGGYFIYESLSGTFDFGSYSVADGPQPQMPGDVVGSPLWFRPEITSGRVSFADPDPTFALPALFVGNAESACSFCTATDDGRRGAMVFSPDGEVTFRDGTGSTLGLTQGALTLSSNLDPEHVRAAIAVSATGLTRVAKP